jgi:hypothetical protein
MNVKTNLGFLRNEKGSGMVARRRDIFLRFSPGGSGRLFACLTAKKSLRLDLLQE